MSDPCQTVLTVVHTLSVGWDWVPCMSDPCQPVLTVVHMMSVG